MVHGLANQSGGGLTITSVTLRTHTLPRTIGAVLFTVKAESDEDWRALVSRIMEFYAGSLFNASWGEQIGFSPDRKLSITMLFHDLDETKARAVWQPFLSWIAEKPKRYIMSSPARFITVPRQRFWEPAFLSALPGVVRRDDRHGAPAENIFWSGNLSEAGQVLYAYQSPWVPAALLDPAHRPAIVDALVRGSSEWSMTLHMNKGLAGGSPLAHELSKETATNPAILDAFALLICAANAPPAWPGIARHEPDLNASRRDAEAVRRAMRPIRDLVPDAGAYVSEADYFDVDWQRRYWGSNYPRRFKPRRASIRRRCSTADIR